MLAIWKLNNDSFYNENSFNHHLVVSWKRVFRPFAKSVSSSTTLLFLSLNAYFSSFLLSESLRYLRSNSWSQKYIYKFMNHRLFYTCDGSQGNSTLPNIPNFDTRKLHSKPFMLWTSNHLLNRTNKNFVMSCV